MICAFELAQATPAIPNMILGYSLGPVVPRRSIELHVVPFERAIEPLVVLYL